jgi:hypothetical protein
MLAYSLAVLTGALLLFLVQPLLARHLLPLFGGSAAVWTACMLFFQGLLLAGYAWAHGLTRLARRRGPAWAAGAHLTLLALAVGQLGWQAIFWPAPLLPPAELVTLATVTPTAGVLAAAGLSLGLPFMLLAASSPLMQAWFHTACPGRSPYPLYALSNLGSLAALGAYPFLLEPLMGLRAQAWLWAAGLGLYALAVLLAARRVLRAEAAPDRAGQAPSPASTPAGVKALWVLLPMAASMVLLAATQQLTQDVAPIPFLWVLPLALYLATFVLAFADPSPYRRKLFLPALAAAVLLAGLALLMGSSAPLLSQVSLLAGAVFACGMACHGELVRLKPPPAGLTGFYLALALGGALGGLFVGLAAPWLFTGNFELHLGLGLCLGLVGWAWLREPGAPGPLARLALATLGLALVAPLGVHAWQHGQGAVYTHRDFYGALRVQRHDEDVPARHRLDLVHGAIVHGLQYVEADRRRRPTAYYGVDSGLGLAIREHPARQAGRPLHLGVIGLGVGTLAAHGLPGDRIRFYELAPAVVALARGQGGFFHYLADSPAEVEVLLGDGRLSLARELEQAGPRGFDLLVVDAFTSDAIPVHLLTREALELYRAHLAPGGLLALHLTNRHLALEPLVTSWAAEVGWPAAQLVRPGDGELTVRSRWVLLGQSPGFWARPEPAAALAASPAVPAGARPWSDDHSDLLRVLR